MLPSHFLWVLTEYSTVSYSESNKKTNERHRDMNSKEWRKIVIIKR